MKKILALVALALCTGIFTACHDDDKPDTPKIIGVEPQPINTADEVNVKTSLLTYVFPHTYEQTCKHLVDRVTNRASSLNDEVKTVIFNASQMQGISDADFTQLTKIYARGGNIVMAHGSESMTYELYLALFSELQELIAKGQLHTDITPGVLTTMHSVEPNIDTHLANAKHNDTPYDLVAIRGLSTHIVADLDGPTGVWRQETQTTVNKETGEVKTEKKEPYSVDDITPATYGLHADMMCQWLNAQPEQEEHEKALLEEGLQMAADNAMPQREVTQYLYSQDVSKSMSAGYHNFSSELVEVFLNIWTVHSQDKNKDYYLVKQQIRTHNKDLQCGPQRKETFWSGEIAKEAFGGDYGYGPWLNRVENSLDLNAPSYSITDERPLNVDEGVDYSQGFSANVSGSISFAKEPSISVGGDIGWSSSESRKIYDLKTNFESKDNIPYWNSHCTKKPETHWGIPDITHDTPREHLITLNDLFYSATIVVDNPDKAYTLRAMYNVNLEGLHMTEGLFKTYENYHGYDSKDTLTVVLNCPPRHVQNWKMAITPHEVSEPVVKFLKTYFKDYKDQDFKLPVVDADDRTRIDERINLMVNILNTNKKLLLLEQIPNFKLMWKNEDDVDFYATREIIVNE